MQRQDSPRRTQTVPQQSWWDAVTVGHLKDSFQPPVIGKHKTPTFDDVCTSCRNGAKQRKQDVLDWMAFSLVASPVTNLGKERDKRLFVLSDTPFEIEHCSILQSNRVGSIVFH